MKHICGRKTLIKELDGIGPKRAELFNKLGIFNVEDLLYHFPRGYENRGNIKKIASIENGEVCSIEVIVTNNPSSVNLKNRLNLTKFKCRDNTGDCEVTFYNQEFIKKVIYQGEYLRLYGKMERKGKKVLLNNPTYEFIRDDKKLKELYPVYALTQGLTQSIMSKAIDSAYSVAFSSGDDSLKDILPFDIRKEYNLPDLAYALFTIHHPTDYENVKRAKTKIAFDELYEFSFRLLKLGKKNKHKTDLVFNNVNRIKFLRQLNFELTNAQFRTIEELENDMLSGTRMQRLVTGDVGSGKTVCAMYALYISCENGYQGALMAPTEILARQHYIDLEQYFKAFNYKVDLLTSSTKQSERKRIIEQTKNGEIDILIGTHSLLNENVTFLKLGVVIIDEQHRFGVGQRALLTSKNNDCHVLAMTATPIPRTLAKVLYGDMDISTIDELPPGRKKVNTFLLDDSYRERLYEFIRKTINEGGQVYIVCPSVENEKNEDIQYEYNLVLFSNTNEIKIKKSAVDYSIELQNEIFPEFRVAYIHGKMKNDEKNEIMSSFKNGDVKILVSTTVIEVGVNVPNATIMVVENAEYFGLSQLHQLRGRVGRGNKQSYCFLMSNNNSPKSNERLNILTKTNNGFEISKCDLEMRGPGDIVGLDNEKIKQSGESKIDIALKIADASLLYASRAAAEKTFIQDPDLQDPKNAAFKTRIDEHDNKIFVD